MSIRLLQQFDQAEYKDITSNERLILITLITSAEKGGNFSWAGINLIRQRTKIENPTHIHRALRGLIRKGYLKRDRQEGKGKLRSGFVILIPTKKMKSYREFKELESDQIGLREQTKMVSKGVTKLVSINSKDRNSKKRNSKNLLATPKDKENGISNFPIGSNMNKKKFKKPNKNIGMTVDDIVSQQMKEKPINPLVNFLKLFDIWCTACRKKDETYKGFCNGKIRGNLKYILKHIKGLDLDPKHFIETIVGDWYGFQQMAKDQDAKSTSLYPSIPYLTQYLDSAVLFYGGRKGYKKPTQESPKLPVVVEPMGSNLGDSEKEVAEGSLPPKKGLKSVSQKPHLTPEEQEEQLESFMVQVKKDKEKYLKEKKRERK